MASVVPLRKSRRVIDGIGNLVGTHCHRFSVEHVATGKDDNNGDVDSTGTHASGGDANKPE